MAAVLTEFGTDRNHTTALQTERLTVSPNETKRHSVFRVDPLTSFFEKRHFFSKSDTTPLESTDTRAMGFWTDARTPF